MFVQKTHWSLLDRLATDESRSWQIFRVSYGQSSVCYTDGFWSFILVENVVRTPFQGSFGFVQNKI